MFLLASRLWEQGCYVIDHSAQALLGKIRPGNGDEVLMWQNFPARLPRYQFEKPRSRESSQPTLSYEHIENFIKDLELRRDLGNRASPVNQAQPHMRRPLLFPILYPNG